LAAALTASAARLVGSAVGSPPSGVMPGMSWEVGGRDEDAAAEPDGREMSGSDSAGRATGG
jgi:hypothetical protein